MRSRCPWKLKSVSRSPRHAKGQVREEKATTGRPSFYGLGRTICTDFLKKMRSYLRPKHVFPFKSDISDPQHALASSFSLSSHPRIYQGFLFVTSKTLRKSVRQNTVQIYTASTYTHPQAHFITINHQTRIVSIFRRPTELGYKKVRPTKEPPCTHLRPNQERETSSKCHSHFGKMVARNDTSTDSKNQK